MPELAANIRLVHYSRWPLKEVWDCRRKQAVACKPDGLWASCDEYEMNWPHWCREAGFELASFNVAQRVHLAPAANVLVVSGASAIDAFTKRYETTGRLGRLMDGWMIDWPRVAADYQGIVITPYCWSRRLATGWYHGWDCASGCIWDPAAVQRIERLPECFNNEERTEP